VVRVHGMPQSQPIRDRRGPEENRLPSQGKPRPCPYGNTENNEESVDDADAASD